MIRDRLWLAAPALSRIYGFRPGSGIVSEAAVSFDPRNVVILQSGKIVALANNRAAILSPTGDLLQEPAHSLGWLKAACPAHGTAPVLYATDQEGNKLHKLDGSGGELTVIWSRDTCPAPRAVLALPPPIDLVFVACKIANEPSEPGQRSVVDVFSSAGQPVGQVSVPFGARGLAYRRQTGTVYVSSFGVGTPSSPDVGNGTTVTAIDVATLVATELSCPAGPYGMTVDRLGRLWVACGRAQQLWSPDASGLDLPGGCLSLASYGGDRLCVGYKDQDVLTEVDVSGSQASIVTHHALPAVLGTETLGDWSGAWQADWLTPYEDADGDGNTDGEEFAGGGWPFPT